MSPPETPPLGRPSYGLGGTWPGTLASPQNLPLVCSNWVRSGLVVKNIAAGQKYGQENGKTDTKDGLAKGPLRQRTSHRGKNLKPTGQDKGIGRKTKGNASREVLVPAHP